MKIVTRRQAIKNLQAYVGQDLKDLARKRSITIFKDGKQNKGWKGHVLELLAGLENNSIKAPNGLGFELKSVSFYTAKGEVRAKETMAITMINPVELAATPFFESHCWEKLKSVVFCAVEWTGKNAGSAKLMGVSSFDFLTEDEIVQEIKRDYELIQQKLVQQGFTALTGRDGKWIQARTKGAGHGSTSRAFYARKSLVNYIFAQGQR